MQFFGVGHQGRRPCAAVGAHGADAALAHGDRFDARHGIVDGDDGAAKKDDIGWTFAQSRVELISSVEGTVAADWANVLHRHRIEPCTLFRPEHIAKMGELGLSPSLLIGHVYYCGRVFRDTLLGPARADLIEPCASARKAGLGL
jgi:hypothetical protein